MPELAAARAVDLYRARTPTSARLFADAERVLPGGVTHSNRYWAPYPLYVDRVSGSRLFDVDGNEYIDYWVANGTMFMGHAHPAVAAAVRGALERGSHFGLSHDLIPRLAAKVVDLVPSAELVRFTNSGTEATAHALRIARAYTRRRKIARFEGTFHGILDGIYVGFRPPFDGPECAGIPPAAYEDLLICPFNDLEGTARILRRHGEELAGVILEPISGAIPAAPEFLQGLRELTRELGAVLIYDEIVTGFRMAPGGAQEMFGVLPDLTLLGKVLGGGLPVGAVAGRKEVMDVLRPGRPKQERVDIYGTYSGNVAVMAAGLAVLGLLADGRPQQHAAALGERLADGLRGILERHGEPAAVQRIGCLVQVYFGLERAPRNHREEAASDLARRRQFHLALMTQGVFFKPGSEGRVSAAHSARDIEQTLERMDSVIAKRLHIP
ncbi:MAG TPA: aminotransferase class III-fold pyridoxal phosphate-dependent enzyme [Burkholderiales bacterium]|nr:aminotransferase class III-fold pyridoxal phosphate-dependent enzyme [Burkholderiales bacterium]